jgi:hypothetical protein
MSPFVFCRQLVLFTCNLFLSKFQFVMPSMMEKTASVLADDDMKAYGVSMGSSSAKSTIAFTKCLCRIELSLMTSRTQKNLGRRFIGCGKYNVQI